jgi:hypothetical protein
MEDLILVRQVLDRPVRKHLPHPGHEVLPVRRPMEVVDHQEPALQQILPEPLRLLVRYA